MRQLRFVRPTDDGTHLVVETDDGSEQFRLRFDARMHDLTRPDLAHAAVLATPAATLEIGPREIQVRIRAGESPQELAESLGVAVERVLRFAAPVMDERLRIADEARRGRAHRNAPDGIENKIVVFGEAVDARFTAHGIVAADVAWDSRRRDDGEWIIVAGWLGGEGRHTAEWLFHRSSRSVTPLDDTATDLLSDRPIRPVAPPTPEPERPSLAAAPPLAPGVVAFPAFADAQTGPLPVVDDAVGEEAVVEEGVFDQDAPHAELETGLNFDAPPLPLGITDPSTRPGAVAGIANLRNLNPANRATSKRGETDDDRAARARVPSWDDILLGVRRPND